MPKLPHNLSLGSRILEKPLIQGGMGVGVSLGNLAGAVMKEGGMGVISAAHPGYAHPDFSRDPVSCNVQAIFEEARRARAISQGRGLLGLNILCASQDYPLYVQAALEAGYDAILSGAGLPLQLPQLVRDKDICLAPIVSGGRAASLLCRHWKKHAGRLPDFVVCEGPCAGGHLGFSRKDLETGSAPDLADLVREVRASLVPFEQEAGRSIPVFAAGGIFDGQDMARMLEAGAVGVQMATRFIATPECDAHDAFKQALLKAEEQDIVLIDSPVGLPGRAVRNRMVQETRSGPDLPAGFHCLQCLKGCHLDRAGYCISQKLIQAVSGDTENGLVFCSTGAARLQKMESVHDIMQSVLKEAERSLA